MSADEMLDYAEREAIAAGITSAAEIGRLQGFLLGLTLTHFEEVPIVPMTEARWRRAVRAGIDEARRP